MHNTTAPANNMKFTRVCIDCGKVMHNVGYSRKRCPACARKAKLMACAAYNAAHKEDMSIPEPRPDTIPSPEIIRERAKARAYAASLEPPDDYYFEPGPGEDQPEEDEP